MKLKEEKMNIKSQMQCCCNDTLIHLITSVPCRRSLQKAYFFSLHLQQVNIQLFHPPKFQPLSACYHEEIHLDRSDFRGCHFELSLATRLCLCDVIPPNLKLAGRRKTCNQLCIVHKVSKMYFSKRLSTSFSLLLSFFRVWIATMKPSTKTNFQYHKEEE